MARATELSASDLAREIRGGAKPTDALEAVLGRYDSAMKYSGCLTPDFTADEVRHTVKSALSGNLEPGAALTSNPRGALAGVPFIASAAIDVAGRATTAGCPIMEAGRATTDAAAVAALKAAGAVFLGHSSMSQLGLGLGSARNVRICSWKGCLCARRVISPPSPACSRCAAILCDRHGGWLKCRRCSCRCCPRRIVRSCC